ncbi:DUF3742 family protein [Pseudomonas aeruginosa]
MNDVKQMSVARRAGHTVGRWFRPVLRLETALLGSLVKAGVPQQLVLILKWGIRLPLALGLLYVAFLPVLVGVALIAYGRSNGSSISEEEEFWQAHPVFKPSDLGHGERGLIKDDE